MSRDNPFRHPTKPPYPNDELHCDQASSPQAVRDTFQTRVIRALEQKRREVVALEQLEKHCALVEPGSPLEELLWSLSNNL